MGNIDLGGFDVVVHLAESVINRGLELLPSGSTFPVATRRNITLTALQVPTTTPTVFRNVPLLYDAFVELERPQVVLDQQTNTVKVTCDLSPASQLTLLRAVNTADAALLAGSIPQIPIAGSVTLDCPLDVDDIAVVWGGQAVAGRAAVARAANVTATLALDVPSADTNDNVQVASSAINATVIQIATSAIQAALQLAIGTAVGNDIGNLPLTNPVRLNAGAIPVQTVRDVQARISPAGSPAAISLGVLTAIEPRSPGGVIPQPPASLPDTGALLGVLNYWTLHLVSSAMTAAHPAMRFEVDDNPPRASFEGAVVFDGGEEPITVRGLDITVNPAGGLAVVGRATASGSCWDADIDFDFNFTFTCDPDTGAVVAAASEPNVTVDVDKDLWCQIVGIIVGAIGGFITGAIIGAIATGGNPLGALVGGAIGGVVGGIGGGLVADALIDPLDLDGVSLDSLSVLGGLTLPLPVGAAGLLVDTCDFDDLIVSGNLVYVDFAERHRAGEITLPAGSGFDLDRGVVRPSLDGTSDDVADLLWTGAMLRTVIGATASPSLPSGAFDTLSLTDLEGLAYSSRSISLLPFATKKTPRASVVEFGIRTDEGRYGKCRARATSAGLKLEYVVYASPLPCLSSVVTVDTLSHRIVESGVMTCTEVHDEIVLVPDVPVIGPKNIADHVVPEMATLARVLPSLDIRPIRLPPIKPQRACGEHQTVEHHLVEWQVVEREQRATIRVLPSGVAAPLTYRWSVFGTAIVGTGTTTVGAIDVIHDENSPILMLLAEPGEDLVGSVVIYATDADGRKLRVTRHLHSTSRKRVGGCCSKRPTKLTLLDALHQLEAARIAQRVFDAGLARLQRIAGSGKVAELDVVSFADAVKRLRTQ